MDALKQLDDLVHRRQLEWHWIGSDGELMPIGAHWHWYTLISSPYAGWCRYLFLGFSENLDCHQPLCPCRLRYDVACDFAIILPAVEWCLIDLNGTNDRWPSCWVNMLPCYPNSGPCSIDSITSNPADSCRVCTPCWWKMTASDMRSWRMRSWCGLFPVEFNR